MSDAPFAAVVVLLFVTVSVYVICAPVATGLGAADPETERLGVKTVMGALALEPPGVEVTESVMVPFPVVGLTVIVMVKVVVSLVR